MLHPLPGAQLLWSIAPEGSSEWEGWCGLDPAMWWRSPWLRRRTLLIGLAGFDLMVVVLAYNAAYHARFSAWPGLSNAVLGLIGIWLGASYLLGRYSRPQGAPTWDAPCSAVRWWRYWCWRSWPEGLAGASM